MITKNLSEETLKKLLKTPLETLESFNDLPQAEAQQKALDYLYSIPSQERKTLLQLLNRNPGLSRLSYIGEWDGHTGPNTLIVSYLDANGKQTGLDEVKEVYRQAFNQISIRLKEAKEAGKPFHLVCGEGHLDRNNLLMERIILSIAKRFNVQQFNFEYSEKAPEPYIRKDGRKVILEGFKSLVDRIAGSSKTTLPEDDPEFSLQPDSKRINRDFILHHLTHPYDPQVKLSPIDNNLSECLKSNRGTMFNVRDPSMADLITEQSCHSISFVGADHLEGIKENSPNVITISAQYSKALNHSKPEILKEWTPEKALFEPDMYFKIPGKGITTAAEAERLASAADRDLGNRLTKEFFNNPENRHLLPPQQRRCASR